jgi:hypothetical protein
LYCGESAAADFASNSSADSSDNASGNNNYGFHSHG